MRQTILYMIAIMVVLLSSCLLGVKSLTPHCHSSFARRTSRSHIQRLPPLHATLSKSSLTSTPVGPHIPLDLNYDGLEQIHVNPDIFVLRNFLSLPACQDIRQQAQRQTMGQSPVAYAGWTDDVQTLVELAAKGPVAWVALIGAWWQVQQPTASSTTTNSQVDLVVHTLQNYALGMVVATALIAAFTWYRANSLQSLRTSTSITLNDLSLKQSKSEDEQVINGTREFVQRAAELFTNIDDTSDEDNASSLLSKRRRQQEAGLFEAPTIIRYEPNQLLAPHFDANQSADTEDANRGGQTLATLIVYLNNVEQGGLTRFGKLKGSSSTGEALTVQPAAGDALLFFPADAAGNFDDRLEHEGCPAVDEKWIARIWRHQARVPPPFGLSTATLQQHVE